MKLFTGLLLCSWVLGVSSEGWLSFIGEAIQGKARGGRWHPQDIHWGVLWVLLSMGALSECVLPGTRCSG